MSPAPTAGPPDPGPAAGPVVALDTGQGSLREADHLLRGLAAALGDGLVLGCTHFAGGAVVLSLGLAGGVPVDAVRALTPLAPRPADGHEGGRAVVFPGEAALRGTLPVADVLARSAVARVVLLGGGGDVPGDVPLVTRDHVRPLVQAGRLVLTVDPLAGGRVTPFETPTPTPCCADH